MDRFFVTSAPFSGSFRHTEAPSYGAAGMQQATGRLHPLLLLLLLALSRAQPCDPGTEPVQGTCVNCDQGKFKASAGAAKCLPCPLDTFSAGERAEDMVRATPYVKRTRAGVSGQVISVSGSEIEAEWQCKVDTLIACSDSPPKWRNDDRANLPIWPGPRFLAKDKSSVHCG